MSPVPYNASVLGSVLSLLARAHSLGGPRSALDEGAKILAEDLYRQQDVYEDDWDPEDQEVLIEEASVCRALLLDIVRRAVSDWVLYRSNSRIHLRALAQEAYVWLFEEGPGHPWWDDREGTPKQATSFLAICDVLEIEPGKIRERAKLIRPVDIKTAGRPPERRRKVGYSSSYSEYSVADVDVASLESVGSMQNTYEAHFSVAPGGYL